MKLKSSKMSIREKNMRREKLLVLENIKKLENTKAYTGKDLNQQIKDTLLYSFRYVYITAFFFLLSGSFAPIIKQKNYELPFVGVIILYIGLLGAIFLYESTQQKAKQTKFLIIGFTLISLSTGGIYMIVGV